MVIHTLGLELVASHLVGDFALQSDRMVQAKKAFRLDAFLRHAVLQAALAYVFAGMWGIWEIPLVIGLSHCVIDCLKESALRFFARKNDFGKPVAVWKFWLLLVDQAVHIGVIAALVWYLREANRLPAEAYWSALAGAALWRKSLVIWIGVLATVYAGGVLIGILAEPFLAELKGPDGALRPEKRGLENGGKRIGQIELRADSLAHPVGPAGKRGFSRHREIRLPFWRTQGERRPQGSGIHHHRHDAQLHLGDCAGLGDPVRASGRLSGGIRQAARARSFFCRSAGRSCSGRIVAGAVAVKSVEGFVFLDIAENFRVGRLDSICVS